MNAVVKQTDTPLAVADTTSLLAVIQRAATDPSVDVEKMERLMSMARTVAADRAEAAFNAAFSECQSEMRQVAQDASNPQTKSKYASYAALDRALRPIYTKNGFSLSFDTGANAPADMVEVLGYLAHRDGHSRTYRALMPADGKGAKGGDVMTKTHAMGAGMSYGMRYLLKLIFNVATGEGDRDGNDPNVETITEEQAANLNALVDECPVGTRRRLLEAYKVERIADLPATVYATVMKRLEKTRAEGGK